MTDADHNRTSPRIRRAGALALAPASVAAGWIAWSHFGIDHRRTMPPALSGRRQVIDTKAGRVSFYEAATARGRPLLLVHSINAAANAYEVRPLYEHYRRERPVYALDLPGFGFSERSDRLYTPRLMADAIHAVTALIQAHHGAQAIDAMALSLSCAYLARAALERPDTFASLGLISPAGFDARLSGYGPPQGHRGKPNVRSVVAFPLWGRPLFDALVSRPSMRFFLEKTWGSKAIDEGLFEYDQLSAHRPGAHYAPFSFLTGHLFPTDVTRVYEALRLPIWAVHGRRGDFVDYGRIGEVTNRRNWTIDRLPTGAFPHFEDRATVTRLYDSFLARQR